MDSLIGTQVYWVFDTMDGFAHVKPMFVRDHNKRDLFISGVSKWA